jgi:hypothetical protein
VTVAELIARLEQSDPEAEVLLAHQPGWPLRFTIAGVCDWEGVEDDDDHVAMDAPVVYICEGQQPDGTPYAPGELWDMAWT